MGGCLNSSKNEIKECIDTVRRPSTEISYQSSSFAELAPSQNTTATTTSPRISIMARYVCTDKIIHVSGSNHGFFSSISAVTPSTKNTPRNGYTKVTSQLFLGSMDDARNEAELRAKRVTHIISLIGHMHQIAGMKQMQCPMHDYGQTDLK